MTPSKTSSPSSSQSWRDFNFALVPLTLFYSSLTKLFLLFLLTIWTPASPSSTSQSHLQIQFNWLNAFSNPLEAFSSVISLLSRVFDDDKLDREWVIRNVLGGMSAGFGLRGLHSTPEHDSWSELHLLVNSHSWHSSLLLNPHHLVGMGLQDSYGSICRRVGRWRHSTESSVACSQYSLRLPTLRREIIVPAAVTQNMKWLYWRHEWLIFTRRTKWFLSSDSRTERLTNSQPIGNSISYVRPRGYSVTRNMTFVEF